MYYKHKEWLEQASIDSRILQLIKKRQEKHTELIYLKYEHDKALRVLGIVSNALFRTSEEYKDIDLDLAFIDGRYSICDPPKVANKKRSKKSKPVDIKAMSKDQINSLIDELLKMKGK